MKFYGEISLDRIADDLDKINLIWQNDPTTLQPIITSIKFAGFDGRRLHHPHFIFSDVVDLKDIQSIEPIPSYYD